MFATSSLCSSYSEDSPSTKSWSCSMTSYQDLMTDLLKSTVNILKSYLIYVDEIPYHVFRGLACYLYDIFMIYIPFNEMENLVDLSIHGYTSSIKKVVINGHVTGRVEYPKEFLNRLTNFIHLNFQMKELHMYQQEVIDILREMYESKLAGPEDKLLPKNTIEITYYTNGMTHKLKIDIDKNWKIINDPSDPVNIAKNTSVLLHKYRYVISLQNNPIMLNKSQFIKAVQKLPLINYLCSFEHTEITSPLPNIKEVKYFVTHIIL